MMTKPGMTDWKTIAIAKGLPPEERVVLPLQKLEMQFRELKAQIRLETEPVNFHVLPLPESER